MEEDQSVSAIEKLTETIKRDNARIQQMDNSVEVEKAITSLEKSGTENAATLREVFNNALSVLENPKANQEQLEIAQQQLESIKELSGSEEENREAAKKQEQSNELLSRVVSGINGLADSYEKQLEAMLPSGGILAGLGAAALLFMDPETLMAGVSATLDGIYAIIDSIKLFLSGDFTAGFELLGENIIAVSAILGTVAVLFGGRIIRTVAALLTGAQKIFKAVRSVGGFIFRLAGRFSGLVKIFGKLFLPFTIITGAIGAIQGAIDGFQKEGILGGIEGGITGLLTTIVGFPLDLLTNAVAWIAGKLGFTEAETVLNEFSWSDLITDAIGGIFDMISSAFTWIGTLFTDPVEALTTLWNALVSGANWLTDIVFAPLNSAISWVSGLFGWDEPEEGFKLQDTIRAPITAAIEWIKGLFVDPVKALGDLKTALLGEGGILEKISAPIDSAINWVIGLFPAWAQPENDFSLSDTLFGPIDSAITWLQGLFADPKAALQQAWTGLVGEGGLVDIIFKPVDKGIAWVMGLFSWEKDPETGFTVVGTVKAAFESAKNWIVGLFTWSSEAGTGEDGSWSLSTFIPEAFGEVKTWFLGKFTFATELATEGWTNLKDFASSKFSAVKSWFTGLFSWGSEGLSEGWTNLTDFVKGKWTEVKTWFTGLFTWSAADGEENVIMTLFNSTISDIKAFFTDLFDFLPSFEDIKAVLTSILPSWMQPTAVAEQRQSIEDEISQQQAEISSGDLRNWRGKKREEVIEELQAELASLPQANMGGLISAPESGTPVMLHGQEIVTPLNSPQGQVLSAINNLMNNKAEVGTSEYATMSGSAAGAMFINGGTQGPQNSNNSTNISNSNYTIQQGITPDDFLKRDFLNYSY